MRKLIALSTGQRFIRWIALSRLSTTESRAVVGCIYWGTNRSAEGGGSRGLAPPEDFEIYRVSEIAFSALREH